MSSCPAGPFNRGMQIAVAVLMVLILTGCTCRVITARDYLVLRVVDGDTFKVHYDGEPTSVRFIGIDAPELTEAGGPEATAALDRVSGTTSEN